MPIDGGFSATELWQIVKPVQGQNLVTNPSFELGTTGWSTSGATLPQTAGGAFGAYMGRMLSSTLGGNASHTLSTSLASGTPVVLSAWVTASSTSVLLRVSDGVTTPQQAHPGDGLRHRLSVALTMGATIAPTLQIMDMRASAWSNVDIDGVMLESGVTAASTYIDGDQDGCLWNGAPHASTSTRDGRDPRGGAILSLAALGLDPKTWSGIGAPDVEVATQTLALGDGEIYQRTTAKPRVIQLSSLLSATNLAGLHAARRTALDALSADIRTNRGPIRLRYSGAAVPKTIDAVLESGYGFDKPFTQRNEMAALRFLAPDPIWQGETDEQAVLTTGLTVTGVENFAMRLPDGTWTNMAGGPTLNANGVVYFAIKLLDGRVVIGGTDQIDFGGEVAVDFMGVWNGTTWTVLGTGASPNTAPTAVALGNSGILYVGGSFTSIGGIAINRIAQWSPVTNAWTTVGTGGANGNIAALAVDPVNGSLWASGSFTTIGGVSIAGLAVWEGTTWIPAVSGLPASWTTGGEESLKVGPDGRMYLAVASTSGTKGVYVWNTQGTWALFSATTGSGAFALLNANGKLYVGGIFTAIGGVTVSNIAMASGSGWSSMNGGVVGGQVNKMATTSDGSVYVSGKAWTSIGGIVPPDSIAIWRGSSWEPFSANPPDTASHANDLYSIYALRDDSIVISWFNVSGTFGTTMPTEAITEITVGGSSLAYPVIQFVGPSTIYTIANLTTGQRINMSGCTLVTDETATLDLRPGRKTFGTQVRSLLPTILPGSDFAAFALAPGVNRIAMMATGGTTTLRFRPRYWSSD